MLEFLPWAVLMMRVRHYEHRLLFSERKIFHDALRHPFLDEGGQYVGSPIYPDAFYYTNAADFRRAKAAVEAYKMARRQKALDLQTA